MKKIILLLFMIPTITLSQVKSTSKKLIQVIEPRQIFINSAAKIGGKTRIDIKIDLPPNTTEWYYSFSTTPSTTTNNLNLLGQLTRFYDTTGLIENAINLLSVPDGSAPIDVYLINEKGKDNFYKKDFFNQYVYVNPGSYPEGTAENTRQGKIRIDDLKSGTFYLGIRNPSLTTGINVLIEVVAIVEEVETDNSRWSKETKNKLFTTLNNGFIELTKGNYKATDIEELTACLVDKITTSYTPETFNEMAEYEKKRFYKSIVKECNSNIIINFN